MKKIELEVTINGEVYKGYRIIKTTKDKSGKFQVIHLDEDIYERDGETYTDPNSIIALFAVRDILKSLVRKHLLQ